MARQRKGNNLICYEEEGHIYKICRVIYQKDGSYYVTSSYHGAEGAILVKSTIDYHAREQVMDYANAIDVGFSDDTEGKIKLSHHSSGLVQFSGVGILSGIDRTSGAIKGIGVYSYPPSKPSDGPAFGMVMTGINAFVRATSNDQPAILFSHRTLHVPWPKLVYSIEGFIFKPEWRRFIQEDSSGALSIAVAHPARAVLSLRVVLPPDDWPIPYFVAVEMSALPFQPGMTDHQFTLGGPTGNIRKNEIGHVLGDAIHCIYPKNSKLRARNLDYQRSSVYDLK